MITVIEFGDQLTERRMMTRKLLGSGGWGKGYMPMIDKSKDLLADDSLGVVLLDNPLKIYIGCLFTINLANCETIEFDSIDEMIGEGWIVD
jgi:hypothetical protein